MTTNAKVPVLAGFREIGIREEKSLLTKQEGETGGREEGNPGKVRLPRPATGRAV